MTTKIFPDMSGGVRELFLATERVINRNENSDLVIDITGLKEINYVVEGVRYINQRGDFIFPCGCKITQQGGTPQHKAITSISERCDLHSVEGCKNIQRNKLAQKNNVPLSHVTVGSYTGEWEIEGKVIERV